MTKWNHSRKGEIEGEVVWTSDDGSSVDIQLTRDHKLSLASSWTDPYMGEGDILRCATSMLTLVEE